MHAVRRFGLYTARMFGHWAVQRVVRVMRMKKREKWLFRKCGVIVKVFALRNEARSHDMNAGEGG